ncbi:MAG: glycine--tRNA ligase [Thermoplasmata archaeon]|uniref:glycine--tRNA ligase n=1 Tax=Candidatus Sysuiplasma superficiale TaxID=2823368 RepID=A0A8J7YJ61_9ARCH|nr:glycine--tRNA ligase [Candidatus Sysuiplasma superficiale]MBX8644598.1 glycine--tRNA ligase [Candidatus Sysuiplasma superficiale]MCL4347168.1 glycine--tRNA ligase [Candidatus Thermoplasmatota archaeon]
MSESSHSGAFSEELLLSMMRRRGFIWPSFEIYGGTAGFYDYGPLGLLLRENIRNAWRRIYRKEGLFEIDTPCINPEAVFLASGHVSSFSDLMVECGGCHEIFRADHLLDADISSLSPDKVASLIEKNNVKCPRCGSMSFSNPVPFNLMFRTQIGPSQGKVGYLRPETPQGIFINFQNLRRFYRDSLPFGVLQSGKAFRNEISPRQGLLRLREFNIMEAEIFFDPSRKEWGSLDCFSDEHILFLPRDGSELRLTPDEALRKGFLLSQAHAYFIGLTYRFAVEIGLDPLRLRFRQHRKDELAHYAIDCWDLESEIGNTWVEITGVADRSDYDLKAHHKSSGADLSYFRKSENVQSVSKLVVRANLSKLGPLFKSEAAEVARAIESLDPGKLLQGTKVVVKVGDRDIELAEDCYSVVKVEEKTSGEKIFLHVIEPSSGLDRIFYALLQHSSENSGDRTVLHLKPTMAPIKVAVFPLIGSTRLIRESRNIYGSLLSSGIEAYYDATGSIGRRYTRMDEIGTPFCITVDEDGMRDRTVTVRERDTKLQIRTGRRNIVNTVMKLISGEKLSSLGKIVEREIEEESSDGEDDE